VVHINVLAGCSHYNKRIVMSNH